MIRRLRRILGRIPSLRNGWHLMLAIRDALADNSSANSAEVNQAYGHAEDPWNYGTNPDERSRHLREIAMLDAVRGPSRFGNAMELGCSEGIFTQMLAARCETLLAMDLSPVALARARQRLAGDGRVRFAQFDLRSDSLSDSFDLIVAIVVLEYIRNPYRLRRIRNMLVDRLRSGGFLLLGGTSFDLDAETSWWSRPLIRGGRNINAFFARHPALKAVDVAEHRLPGCACVDVLFQKVS